MIKVLIVDDSPVVREILRDWLEEQEDLNVVGEARDGIEAFDLVEKFSPNVVIMDILMPRMNGLEATEKIMGYYPTPILIFSSTVNNQEMNIAFEAISRGALDVMAKPNGLGKNSQPDKKEFLKKIRILSRIPVIPHPRAKFQGRFHPAEQSAAQPGTAAHPKFDLLAIGASTGGPKAISDILKLFPEDFPVPIVIVQHIADSFIAGMASWLNRESKLTVKVAEQGERLRPATAYLAPARFHLTIRNNIVELRDSGPVNNCKPSVDVLFASLAESFRNRVLAVLLTGMGSDGASGMKQIHERGGQTIVQDEASSIIFGMPASAIKLGGVDEVAPLQKIPDAIFRAFGLKKKGGK